MRVPLPAPHILRQVALRGEAQERLSARSVLALARLGDPSDPGWLLIEEAAWRVETLSTDASADPDQIALQIAGPLGAQRRPAVPALGVLALEASSHGLLRAEDDQVFLTPNAETVAGLRFVLLEPEVPVVAGALDPDKGPPQRVRLDAPAGAGCALRLGLRLNAGARCPVEARVAAAPVPVASAWRLAGGAEGDDVLALQIEVPPGAAEVDLRFSGHPPLAVFLNPALVINAPRCADGRRLTLPPVGPARVDFPEGEALSVEALAPWRGKGIDALLRRLELHRISGAGGLEVEVVQGALLIRRATPGAGSAHATVRWVRRTDGAAGSVGAGAVRIVEAQVAGGPVLRRVTNPFPLRGGQDQESPAAAIGRIYGAGLIPLGSFEGAMADALAAAGLPWHVQLWSRQDGRIHELRTWAELPLASDRRGPPQEAASARRLLTPGALVAAIGPLQGPASAEDHRRAAEVLRAWFQIARVPHAHLSRLDVLPLLVLRALTRVDPAALRLPTPSLFDLDAADLLEDAWGEQRRTVVDAVLVDGIVASASAPGGAP